MPELKGKYETIFIISPTLGEEETKAVVQKFQSLIESNGTIETTEEWGKRRLAYLINDLAEGYYVLVRFESPKSFPAELDRIFHITDGIMRSLIVKLDA